MGIAIRSVLGEPPTGNAVPADVLAPKTFSNADGTDKVGTMTNNGAVSPTALDPGGSYTVPAGYHNGLGVVSAKANTDTYAANARGATLDMGAANLNRYVNTNGVPNANSGTYTFPANDTGGTKDLGESNSYRYVNAQNVYNKGKADGGISPTFISEGSTIIQGYNPNAKITGLINGKKYMLTLGAAYTGRMTSMNVGPNVGTILYNHAYKETVSGNYAPLIQTIYFISNGSDIVVTDPTGNNTSVSCYFLTKLD